MSLEYIGSSYIPYTSCDVTVSQVVYGNDGEPLEDGSNIKHQTVYIRDGTNLDEVVIHGRNTVVLRRGVGDRWHVVSNHPYAITQFIRFVIRKIHDRCSGKTKSYDELDKSDIMNTINSGQYYSKLYNDEDIK